MAPELTRRRRLGRPAETTPHLFGGGGRPSCGSGTASGWWVRLLVVVAAVAGVLAPVSAAGVPAASASDSNSASASAWASTSTSASASVSVLASASAWAWASASAPPSVSVLHSTPRGGEVYRPPLYADVIDPFRPPDQPWLAGNRGLEYATSPGMVVSAIGSGLVVFAGPVAGHLYVTVLHGDGIRSSYSYLAGISVSVGDRVRGGQEVGITGGVPFHLGARIGDTYIDPASLFGVEVGAASVFLVPLGGAGAPGRGVEPTGAAEPAAQRWSTGSGARTGSVLAGSGSILSGVVSGVFRSLAEPDP